MVVQEEGKTDCKGFEPIVVNEAKFPEIPAGSLVKSEGSQYHTEVCWQNTNRIVAQGNRVTAVSKFTGCLGEQYTS